MKRSLFIFALTVALAVFSFAQTTVDGNPSCRSLGYTSGFKLDNPASGEFAIRGIGILNFEMLSSRSASFTANRPFVAAVIVKGGPMANVYRFEPATDRGEHLLTPENGRFDISHIEFCYNVRPTAALVTVSGRVFNKDRPVAGAVVNVIDGSGKALVARTNAFGVYCFELPAGQFYYFGAQSKRLVFGSYAVDVQGAISDLNFYAGADPRTK